MRDPFRPSATIALVLFSALAAHASSLDSALAQFDQNVRNYNLVSFGDASFSRYGDTEGGLAVAGSLYLDGGVVAAQPAKFGLTSDPTLHLGGALAVNGTAYLQSGYASISATANQSWSWNGADNRLSNGPAVFSTVNTPNALGNSDPRGNPGPGNWNFASLRTSFTTISSTLAAAATTGTININGQTLSFAPSSVSAHGVIVFDLDANLLVGNQYNNQMFSNVQFAVPAGDAYVVNVRNAAGRTLFGSGINFNLGAGYDRLLWNIVDATPAVAESVRFGNGGQFFGAVLAPTFNVFNDLGTAVNGQVVAGSYSHSGAELHFTGFDYSYEVPEPSTYGLLGAALCAGLVVWQKRRRRTPPDGKRTR